MKVKLIQNAFLFSFLVFFALGAAGQTCHPDSLKTRLVFANDTDPDIDSELFRHYTFYNNDCINREVLVVHFPGSFDNPLNTIRFPELAANNGFHVINIKYENSISSRTPCLTNPDEDCYYNFRKEILEGEDVSPDISVNSANSAYNRIFKLLKYMHTEYPEEGWDNYFNETGGAEDSIKWEKIIVSGHSQGGGHAALIGIEKRVNRVLMFAAPNDYSYVYDAPAAWTSIVPLTPDSLVYAFNNVLDEVIDFNEQFESCINLGMADWGDTLNVDINDSPYENTRQLYTRVDSTGANHGSVIRDPDIPVNDLGNSLFEPVWEYMLGIRGDLSSLSEIESRPLLVYPNPVTNVLHIQTNAQKNISIELYDLLGKPLAATKVLGYETTLNMDVLEAGSYLLLTRSGDRILSKQIVVKH